ncbi:hypothetical protein HYZ64_01395 [Candidatus Berkelbacteria bacterium]|nr:hypothetical protein [Candidatus Berkelbacteria bacterium]
MPIDSEVTPMSEVHVSLAQQYLNAMWALFDWIISPLTSKGVLKHLQEASVKAQKTSKYQGRLCNDIATFVEQKCKKRINPNVLRWSIEELLNNLSLATNKMAWAKQYPGKSIAINRGEVVAARSSSAFLERYLVGKAGQKLIGDVLEYDFE